MCCDNRSEGAMVTIELMRSISAAIRKALADRFRQIPDMRWENEEYILAGDRAISLWTVRCQGSDGEELNYQGCDIYRFQGDKIIHKNTFWKIVEHKDRL